MSDIKSVPAEETEIPSADGVEKADTGGSNASAIAETGQPVSEEETTQQADEVT